jgi:hypothetical protein
MPSIALTLAFFPEFFVVMTALLMVYEIAAVVIWPPPIEDPAVVEVDKVCSVFVMFCFGPCITSRLLSSLFNLLLLFYSS